MSQVPLTIGQVAEFAGAQAWQVRRAVDSLGNVQRIGANRIIERAQLPAILSELERRGWLPKQELAHA
jgi:hypothetical protein